MALINKHNQEASQGLHQYTLSLNEFADLVSLIDVFKMFLTNSRFFSTRIFQTDEEFKSRYLTVIPNILATSNNSNATNSSKVSKDTLPASYDMRTSAPNLMSSIQNQGSCGSCWGKFICF